MRLHITTKQRQSAYDLAPRLRFATGALSSPLPCLSPHVPALLYRSRRHVSRCLITKFAWRVRARVDVSRGNFMAQRRLGQAPSSVRHARAYQSFETLLGILGLRMSCMEGTHIDYPSAVTEFGVLMGSCKRTEEEQQLCRNQHWCLHQHWCDEQHLNLSCLSLNPHSCDDL